MDSVVVHLHSVDLFRAGDPGDPLRMAVGVRSVFVVGPSGAEQAEGGAECLETAVDSNSSDAASTDSPVSSVTGKGGRWLDVVNPKDEKWSVTGFRRVRPSLTRQSFRGGKRPMSKVLAESPDEKRTIAWKEYHRLPFALPKSPSSRVSRVRSRGEDPPTVRVEVKLTAGGHVVGVGCADIHPLQDQAVALFESSGRKSGEQVAIAHIRLLTEPSAPIEKTVYFIRHGESEYNRSQHLHSVRGMLSEVDHSLSSHGINDCGKLATVISGWASPDEDIPTLVQGYQQRFVAGGAKVLCSPLQRTVQSAMISLADHPDCVANGITLVEPLREIKSRVGFDCVSHHFGKAIEDTAVKELHANEEYGADAAAKTDEGVKRPTVDSSGVDSPWWTEKAHKDTDAEIDARLRRLSATLQHCPERTIILVGHSNLFRQYFKKSIGPKCQRIHRDLAATLVSDKLPNAGCVATRMIFDRTGEPSILDIAVIAGSVQTRSATPPERVVRERRGSLSRPTSPPQSTVRTSTCAIL